MILEGEFKGYKLNGQGRQIKIDSYYVGSFKDGLKNGNGTLTFIGNSSSFTGNWVNDKLVAECLGQLAEKVKNPASVVFDYIQSSKPQTSKVATSTYFVNKNTKKCPVTECEVRDSSCKVPLTDITAGQKSPFSLSAMTNVTAGYNQQICLICKNKHESALVKFNVSQPACATTKNCPVTTCKGQLQKNEKTIKNISFKYTQSNVPQAVQNTTVTPALLMTAKDLFINKDQAKCPITKCVLMENDCNEPATYGFIFLDKNNKI